MGGTNWIDLQVCILEVPWACAWTEQRKQQAGAECPLYWWTGVQLSGGNLMLSWYLQIYQPCLFRSPWKAGWFSDRGQIALIPYLFARAETNCCQYIRCQEHNMIYISTKLSMQYSKHQKHELHMYVYFQSARWRRWRRRGLGCPDSGSPRPSLAAPRGWSPPEWDSRVTKKMNLKLTLNIFNRRNHRKCNIS